jgi:hypothetical protein
MPETKDIVYRQWGIWTGHQPGGSEICSPKEFLSKGKWKNCTFGQHKCILTCYNRTPPGKLPVRSAYNLAPLYDRSDRFNLLTEIINMKPQVTQSSLYTKFKLFWNDMIVFTAALKNRLRIRCHIAFDWLRARSDLKTIIPILVNASFLGQNAFASTLSTLCQIAAPEYYADLAASNIFDGCYTCVRDRLKKLQEHMRGQRDNQQSYEEQFSWQYTFQMLGRLDHDWFEDNEDFEARLDYDKLRLPGHYGDLTTQFETRFTAAVQARGKLFGSLIHCNSVEKAMTALPEFSFLTSVAGGSIEKQYIPDSAIEEIEIAAINKKLAFAYMSKRQAKRFSNRNELHSRSRVSTKKELAAMRNLLPGSMACYYWSCIVSAFGENAFLNTMKHSPIQFSAEELTRRINAIRLSCGSNYASCRDYANYNVAHKHSDIRAFYQSMIEGLPSSTDNIIVDAVNKLLECMNEVSVHTKDATYLWEHGLMSGWRHTMLINTIFNDAIADVVNDMASEQLGTRTLDYLVQGDDTLELHDSPLAAPWIQGLLDTAGRVGKPTKQLMGGRTNGNFEFLRMYYTPTGVQGSAVRAACAFACPDTQKPEMRGGVEIAVALNESLNTIYRRTNRPSLRRSDVEKFSVYWAQQGARSSADRITADMLFAPITFGGAGMIHPLVPPSMSIYQPKIELEKRSCVKDEKILIRRIKTKINVIAPRIDLREYAKSYASDVLTTALKLEHVYDFGQKTGFRVLEDEVFQDVSALNDAASDVAFAEADTFSQGTHKGVPQAESYADMKPKAVTAKTAKRNCMYGSNHKDNDKKYKRQNSARDGTLINGKEKQYRNVYNVKNVKTVNNKMNHNIQCNPPLECNSSIANCTSKLKTYNNIMSQLNSTTISTIVQPSIAQARKIMNNITLGQGELEDTDDRCVMRVVSEFFGGSRTTANDYIKDHGIPALHELSSDRFPMSRGFALLQEGEESKPAKAWHVQTIPSEYARHLCVPTWTTQHTSTIQWYMQMCIANALRSTGFLR